MLGDFWPIGVIIALLLGVIVFAASQPDDFGNKCSANGGHIISSTKSHVGNSYTNGKVGVVTTSTTTRICLTVDGRVLDVD